VSDVVRVDCRDCVGVFLFHVADHGGGSSHRFTASSTEEMTAPLTFILPTRLRRRG
jgi:hypothetical protein